MRKIAENDISDIKENEEDKEERNENVNRFTGQAKDAMRKAHRASKERQATQRATKSKKQRGFIKFVLRHLPTFGTIIIALIILIFIIGILGAINSMPGMVLSNLLSGSKSYWYEWWTGKQYIDEEEVKDLAQYLENMGYSVQGYGFADVKYTDETSSNDGGNTKQIAKVSDNAVQKNNLVAYLAANEATYEKAKWSVSGLVASLTTDESNKDYSSGLLFIHNRTVLEGLINDIDDYVEIDRDMETLRVETTGSDLTIYNTGKYQALTGIDSAYNNIVSFFKAFKDNISQLVFYGNYYEYDLSDWTAKYGRPTEMFIALHLSTMMPDLVYEIATNDKFNTKVDIQFNFTTVEVEQLYVKSKGEEFSKRQIERAYVEFILHNVEMETEKWTVNGVIYEDQEAKERNKSREKVADQFRAIADESEESLQELINKIGAHEKNNQLNLYKVATEEFHLDVGTLEEGDKTGMISNFSDEDSNHYDEIYLDENTQRLAIDYLTFMQFQELYQIFAGSSTQGMTFVELPYIAAVRKHWFYNDINFSKSNNNDYTGVYNTASKARKRVTYLDKRFKKLNESDDEDDELNSDDLEITMDIIFTAQNENEGIYYQVNEPIVVGPNENIIELFKQKYYKYDGNIETARKIAVAKTLDENPSATQYVFQGVTQDISDVDTDELPAKQKPSFGSASDTLSAFSILDNVHTSASEAVYRMLKELATSEEIEGHLEKGSLDETLMNVLLWPIYQSKNSQNLGTVTKDNEKYGIKISGVENETIIAPGDGEIVAASGDSITIKFDVLSDETVELLEDIYEGKFYKIDANVVNGMTMTIKGVSPDVSSGKVSRGDPIASVTDEEVQIVMQHMDKTLVGDEEETIDDDVEDYISQDYTNITEDDYKNRTKNGTALPDAEPTYDGKDVADFNYLKNINPEDPTDPEEPEDPYEPGTEEEDIAWRIWCRLVNDGYSEEAAAGVLGNLSWESGMNPKQIEIGGGGGHGLAQWTDTSDGSRRWTDLQRYANSEGKEWTDSSLQINYLIAEIEGTNECYATSQKMTTHRMSSGKSDYTIWETTNDPQEAAEAFMYWFERPGEATSGVSTRKKEAQRYYNMFHNKSTNSDGPSSELQERIVQIAKDWAENGTNAEGGYCLKWVNDVYQAAGASVTRYSTASLAGYKLGVSNDFSSVPIGAILYGYGSYEGSVGHVGIYIGNNQVVSCIGNRYVKTDTLSGFVSTYNVACWGWASYVEGETKPEGTLMNHYRLTKYGKIYYN